MKMQQGFSIIELIMVMAVSAIIMTSLLQIYNQVTRNMLRVERFVFEDTQVLALKNRLGKDFAGLSAIWFTQAELQAKKEAADGAKASEKKEEKKISKYFYSCNKDGNLEMLTFVTTSALQLYGTAHSRFVRVIYQVEKDPKHDGLLRLMRKEIITPTENISDAALHQGKFYELVGGIKSLNMTYQLIDKVELQKQESLEKSKEESSDTAEENIEKKPIIRTVKQWISDDDKKKSNKKSSNSFSDLSSKNDNQEKQESLGGATVPKFVTMKVVFGLTDKQLEKKYTLEFYIPSTFDSAPKGIVVQ